MQPQATQTPPPPKVQEPPAPASTSTPTSSTPSAPAKTYGKRSLKQWALIYLVIAIVVYAIIYFVWIRKSGTTSGY